MLLVPEVRKTAAFRLHTFADAEEAAAFIQRWFWPGTAGDVIPFWALHERPLDAPGGTPPEAIALVREDTASDLVYCSSFRDMDSARSLLRAKAERGLDLGLTLVYWAAPAAIEYDRPGRVRLTPAAPPAVQSQPAAEPSPAEQQEREPLAIEEQAPPPQTDALDDAPAAELVPEPADVVADEEAEVAQLIAAPDAAPELDGPPEPSEAPTDIEEALPADVEADALPQEEAPADLEEMAEPNFGPAEIAAPVDAPELDAAPEPAETPAEVGESATVSAETSALGGEGAEGEAEVTTERLVGEVGKVLNVTRWDYRQEPFEGFGSPAGKF